MKLFLDANVLFAAAHNEEGLCGSLFRLAASGRCELLASAFAVDEARRNLSGKAPARLAPFQDLLRRITVIPEPAPFLVDQAAAAPLADKDAPILAAAVAGRCEVLVTGDRRHFGHLYGTRVTGVLVLSPAQAFDLLVPP